MGNTQSEECGERIIWTTVPMPTDDIRWTDTDVMVADPLTTVMESTKLVACFTTNYLNIEQPIEFVIKKRAKQLQGRQTAHWNGWINPLLDSMHDRLLHQKSHGCGNVLC